MSYTGYLVGFIVMALLIAAILALGTLHMAGILPPEHPRQEDGQPEEGSPDSEHDTHHHWWHRAA
jgi:hypothetical protein